MLYDCDDWRYIAHVNRTLYAENMYFGQRIEVAHDMAMRMGGKFQRRNMEETRTIEGKLRYLTSLGVEQDTFTRGLYTGSNVKHSLVSTLYS